MIREIIRRYWLSRLTLAAFGAVCGFIYWADAKLEDLHKAVVAQEIANGVAPEIANGERTIKTNQGRSSEEQRNFPMPVNN
jgi:hypothetical protein